MKVPDRPLHPASVVLLCLLDEGEMTVSEVASDTATHPRSAQLHLDRLTTKGYVERRGVTYVAGGNGGAVEANLYGLTALGAEALDARGLLSCHPAPPRDPRLDHPWRWMRALGLFRLGFAVAEIAARLRAHPTSVQRWIHGPGGAEARGA